MRNALLITLLATILPTGLFLNGCGGGDDTIVTPPVVVAAPTSFQATATSSSIISLAWVDNSTNESGFRIERSTSADGTFSQVGSVLANVVSWNNTNLTASTAYYYRIYAFKDAVHSDYATAHATTQSVAPPPVTVTAPTDLTAVADSVSQITLHWLDKSNNEDAFRVEKSLTGGSDFLEISPVTGANTTSYVVTGLSSSTTYYFRIRASKGAVYSGYSNKASTKTADPIKKVTGVAQIYPATDNPWVALVSVSDSGAMTGVKTVKLTKPADFTDVGNIAFTIELPVPAVATEFRLISFNDRNSNGKYDEPADTPSEYLGQCTYRLRYDPTTKKWSLADAFGDPPDWGTDPTLASGSQIAIPAEYEQ